MIYILCDIIQIAISVYLSYTSVTKGLHKSFMYLFSSVENVSTSLLLFLKC